MHEECRSERASVLRMEWADPSGPAWVEERAVDVGDGQRRSNKPAGPTSAFLLAPGRGGAAARPVGRQFPAELWGRVAAFVTPRECVHLCRCAPRLLFPSQLQGLWRTFCHTRGFARIVAEDGEFDEACVLGLPPPLPPAQPWSPSPSAARQRSRICTSSGPPSSCCGYEVDWQRCFQVNASSSRAQRPCHQRGTVYAVVRFLGEELRLPAEAEDPTDLSPDDPGASEHRSWLVQHGFQSPSVLHHALRQVLVEEGRGLLVPIRFRDLVAGRPGFPIRRARFCVGPTPASAIAEWPIGRDPGGAWRWPLPPHQQEASVASPLSESVEDDALKSVGPHPWGRGNGWLVELCVESDQGPGAPKSASRWVHVGRHKPAEELTLGELCRELSAKAPSMGFWPPRPVLPASLQTPTAAAGAGAETMMESVDPLSLLFEDLRWTQGERVHLRGGQVAPRSGWDMTDLQVSPENGLCSAVLFERDATPAVPPPPAAVQAARRCRYGTTGHMKETKLAGPVPHETRLLHCSKGVRQFEFHPMRPNTVLIGRKDGVVAVADLDTDEQTHALEVDSHPILGLAWLHTQPQWAVVGASQSGSCSILRYDEMRENSMEHVRLQPFHHLSSLSVRCTDDAFMTSGFCVDVGLYDIVTGRRTNTFYGLHHNYINILRFAHRTPHLFATASFDHTCKIWDLREPIRAQRPVRRFDTDTLNVLCCFSPDDRHVLCSGVDNALQQFSMDSKQSNTQSPECTRFPLPALGSTTNYRRSLYLADGNIVATAGTNESVVRLYGSQAPHTLHGWVDLRGHLPRRASQQLSQMPRAHPSLWSGAPLDASRGNARLHVRMRREATQSGGHQGPSGRSFSAGADTLRSSAPEDQPARAGAQAQARPQRNAPPAPAEEYVQSLRCHPTDPTLFGAILASSDPKAPDPYIAKVRLVEDRSLEAARGG